MPSPGNHVPALTPNQEAVVKTFGGWAKFMKAQSLDPWNPWDVDKAKRAVSDLATRNSSSSSQGKENVARR